MRIIVREWPCASNVGSNFAGIIFGSAMNFLMRLKSASAFFAYSFEPVALAYSLIAIAAKHSLKT